jgi:hypothetical protein
VGLWCRLVKLTQLTEFKKLAALYGRQTDETINTQIKNGDLVEICHAQQT